MKYGIQFRRRINIGFILFFIVSGLLIGGCKTVKKQRSSNNTDDKKKEVYDGGYFSPSDTNLFSEKDLFLTFPARGGCRTVKYNKEACPHFYCSTSEDWLMREPDGKYLVSTSKSGGKGFVLFPNGYAANRLKKGDLVAQDQYGPLTSYILSEQGVMCINGDDYCKKTKFSVMLGEDDWIREVVDPETHTIRFEIKPNDTGKCRVVTLVLKDNYIVTIPEISEFGNNAIRIFQRAN